VRADGFHLLDAEMITLDLTDTLTIGTGDGLVVDGPFAVGAGDDNLVRRALAAVGRVAWVRLVKRIPPGGGLGGGSADAAAILRWAGVHDLEVATALGADVPFCLVGGRARVRGVGEVIEPRPCVAGEPYALLTPPVSVSTVAAYRAWDAMGGPSAAGPNDLEAAALVVEPSLVRWRDRLGEATGVEPVLAGSGSTWWVPGAFPEVAGVVVARSVCRAQMAPLAG
jgi:4-diphosphocytidyl-2-C-methyl-D-erythritol kinase